MRTITWDKIELEKQYYIKTISVSLFTYFTTKDQFYGTVIKKEGNDLFLRSEKTRVLFLIRKNEILFVRDLEEYMECIKQKQLYDRSLVCEP